MTREERQASIQDFWDEAFNHSKHPEISDTSKAIALECMIEAEKRENPQPLTLEELRRMDGEVVYIPESEEYFGGMGIVSVSQERVVDVGVPKFGYWLFREYGEGWLAYRSKPKEENT